MSTIEKVKSNAVVTASWEGSILTLAVKGAGNIIFKMDDVSPDLIEHAAMHGFEQRLRDRAAIGRDAKSGESATPAEKYERILSLADHYAAGGVWEMRGEGGGKRAEVDIILEALAAVQGVEVDIMSARVDVNCEKRKITRKAYLMKVATSPAVAQKIAAIKYGESEGGDDYLDELEGEE